MYVSLRGTKSVACRVVAVQVASGSSGGGGFTAVTCRLTDRSAGGAALSRSLLVLTISDYAYLMFHCGPMGLTNTSFMFALPPLPKTSAILLTLGSGAASVDRRPLAPPATGVARLHALTVLLSKSYF